MCMGLTHCSVACSEESGTADDPSFRLQEPDLVPSASNAAISKSSPWRTSDEA